MKKIAIIGPINSRGGREIEAAFIANVLRENFAVTIYSTEHIEKENDLLDVDDTLKIFYRYKSWLRKCLAFFKMKIGYDNIKFKALNGNKIKSINTVLLNCDLIFIIAQLTSNHTKQIIELGYKTNKKIIFRTTGTTPKINLECDSFFYLKKVDFFINHSERNSIKFKESTLNYKIIDQCVFNEKEYENLPNRNITKIRKFYCVSRLDQNKDIITVINAFNNLKHDLSIELHIIGDGEELAILKSKAQHKNIKFYGHLPHKEMMETIKQLDCLILSSKEESGPYNALESMMMGIPILSTNVGAMSERFTDEDIWFESSNVSQLCQKIMEFTNYGSLGIMKIQNNYIEKYKDNFCKEMIAKAYLDAVSLCLNKII